VKLTAGLLLTFVGAAVMLVGIFLALRALVGLYQGVLDDPMGNDQPGGGAEPGVLAQQGMYQGVMIGAVGIVPFLAGVVMVKGAIARRLLRARRRADER